jgi:hypothetical protein
MGSGWGDVSTPEPGGRLEACDVGSVRQRGGRHGAGSTGAGLATRRMVRSWAADVGLGTAGAGLATGMTAAASRPNSGGRVARGWAGDVDDGSG